MKHSVNCMFFIPKISLGLETALFEVTALCNNWTVNLSL